MRTLPKLLAAGAAVFVLADSASAQNRGGGRPGGGNGGQRGGPGFNPGGGYRPGGTSFGLTITPGGIGFGVGNGRPGFGNPGFGVGGFGNPGFGFGNPGFGVGGFGGYPNYGVRNYGYNYTPLPYYQNVVPRVYAAPTYVAPAPLYAVPAAPAVVETPGAVPPSTVAAESGLRITDLDEGTAKAAGLRKNDIILFVDGKRTQTFDELRAALSGGKATVPVDYIDAATGETERKEVAVTDTKIGATVVETPLQR